MFQTTLKLVSVLTLGLLSGISFANAECRVSSQASVSISFGNGGNVGYGITRLNVSGSPSQTTSSLSSSVENCGTASSYSTSLYLNNQYLGGGSRIDFDTRQLADGDYQLRAYISDNYSSSSSTQVLRIRNSFVNPAVFDANSYLRFNPDVYAAYGGRGGDPTFTTMHWVYYGIREARRGSRDFWAQEYLANYDDLRAAFGTDNENAILHYVKHGIGEGRQGLTLTQGRVQKEGYFQIDGNSAIYYSNGNDAYCAYANWDDFLNVGGSPDLLNVRRRTDAPPQRGDGNCVVPQPEGFFFINGGGTIYYSNGNNAYCAVGTWEHFVRWNGSGDLSGVKNRNSRPTTRDDGVCR